MPKTRRRSSRDDIIAVFSNLVAVHGYSDTSIGQISEALKISKGTVVHHFKSKIEMLEYIHLSYMHRRLAEAQHIIGSLSTPSSQIAAMIYALVKSHRDDRDATLAFLREFQRFPKFSGAVRVLRDSYTSLVEGIIQRGVTQGVFSTDNTTLVTLQIFGMCNYAWTWYRPEGRFSAEDIAKAFCRTVLIGLSQQSASEMVDLDEIIDAAQQVVRDFKAPPALG